MQPAVAYTRVSTREQDDSGLGLESQSATLTGYANSRQLEIVHLFTDVGSGATPLRDRPQGSRLYRLTESGPPVTILVAKLDRAFRSSCDALATIEAWTARGTALHIVDLGGASMDLASPIGRCCFTMLAACAEFERALISQRTRDALAAKRARGEQIGAPPLGWRYHLGEMVPHPEERLALGYASILRQEGLTLKATAHQLTQMGYRNRKGKPYLHWWVSAVLKTLEGDAKLHGACVLLAHEHRAENLESTP